MSFVVGLTGTHTATVRPEDTAHAAGNPGFHVLSTPILTLFCEIAGHNACVDHYPPGVSTVGIHNDLHHLAPTPVGRMVTVTATLAAIDGKRLTFEMTGDDGVSPIVRGIHERFLVDIEAFLAGIPA